MKIKVKFPSVLVLVGLTFIAISGGIELYAATTVPERYEPTKVYTKSGTRVVYSEKLGDDTYRVGVFQNGWYLGAGVEPKFEPNNSGWTQVGDTVLVPTLDASNGKTNPNPVWMEGVAYGGGALVSYTGACYKAKWWTTNAPTTDTWENVSCPEARDVPNPLLATTSEATETNTVIVHSGSNNNTVTLATKPTVEVVDSAPPSGANPAWASAAIYLAGSVVQSDGVCYKAKWWTSGNTPKRRSDLKNEWDSPWSELKGCPTGSSSAALPANSTYGQTANSAVSDSAQVAAAQPTAPQINTDPSTATAAAAAATAATVTAAIPPVVPKASMNISKPVSAVAPTRLPDTGYAFLRTITIDDWDWLFPLRSGKYAADGGARNTEPFASADGSTDTFSLDAFTRAVLQYNTWAAQNNYKQFLNEGTIRQQAQEFLVFWAKSSRETSGSWSGAPSPWITQQTINGVTTDVWRGGMYWVEEVGYSTDPTTGLSPTINYVDIGSADFPPSPGRSYYGRGPIQLSWNYNYGAFSYWMYDNGLFANAADAEGRCKIDQRDKLLNLPNLVADCGDISIMSAIWFWQTPQGAKPSSHDVIFGEAINISQSSQDRGLPQTNSGYVPKVASGDTIDTEVFAFRLGTVINIVNGGLECNKAAQWHNGPLQRVSYYNAYAAHFNEKYKLDVPLVPEATNVWTQKVSATSPLNLQSATCFNQKSYYGW
jgi:hypothetical protein